MNSVAALLIFLLLRLPSPTLTHHIVFKEIGEMAGALSYIHAVIPVNISVPKSTTFAGITNSLRPKSIR